jgi:phosphoribosylaminoimidazole-succinocarboxamide synthase
MEYKKGSKIAEGKTKEIWTVAGIGELVIVKNKPDITADDDPTKTRQFEAKAVYATTTTCRVFELLNACRVETAFVEQISPTEFVMKRCEMVALEAVARRLAVGSFLKRHPNLVPDDPAEPHRFHRLWTELFLKTTGGKLGDFQMPRYAGEEKPIDDPLIVDPYVDSWQLAHPKAPSWTPEAVDGEFPRIPSSVIIDDVLRIAVLDEQLRMAALIIEKAWAVLGITWLDIKLEFDTLLRISDVIDNDSWRLLKDGEKLDKQVFRDGGEDVLDEVERKYGLVANLSERLVLPRQALVIWKGSESDNVGELPNWPGVTVEEVITSGHKGTVEALQRAERLFRESVKRAWTNAGFS